MEQHLHNWLHTPSAYDVLFVRWVQGQQTARLPLKLLSLLSC